MPEHKICPKLGHPCIGSCNGSCYIELRSNRLAEYILGILDGRSGAYSRLKGLPPEDQQLIANSIRGLALAKIVNESLPGREGDS